MVFAPDRRAYRRPTEPSNPGSLLAGSPGQVLAAARSEGQGPCKPKKT